MTSSTARALPAQLKKALEHHRNQSDITDDEELQTLMDKLDSLEQRVSFYKAKLKRD
jgi:polyhydroxyalkanoate synthesis regulator phasin